MATIDVEFRLLDNDQVKRAAQPYRKYWQPAKQRYLNGVEEQIHTPEERIYTKNGLYVKQSHNIITQLNTMPVEELHAILKKDYGNKTDSCGKSIFESYLSDFEKYKGTDKIMHSESICQLGEDFDGESAISLTIFCNTYKE